MGLPNCRMVHTQIWESDQFLKLNVNERLLYIGMITIADDEGRLRGDARYLKRQFFYTDRVSVQTVEKMIARLEKICLIKRYEVDDSQYVVHPHWQKYQKLRPDRLRISHIPSPPSDILPQTDYAPSPTRETREVKSVKGTLKENAQENGDVISPNLEEIGDELFSTPRSSHADGMRKGIEEHRKKGQNTAQTISS